jgi:hypothetical protein
VATSPDSVTVRVQSDMINVAVKVARFHRTDPNLLARALAMKTHAVYGSGGLEVARHKKRHEDYGEYGMTFIAQCRSDRPAFVIKEESDDSSRPDLLHLYCAMGLPDEHALQQTLLARCKNSMMAACFTHVASVALNLDIEETLITGDPDRCPSFLDALIQIGATVPDAMRIPQDTAFLTADHLHTMKETVEQLASSVHTATAHSELPLMQLHVSDRDAASESEVDYE